MTIGGLGDRFCKTLVLRLNLLGGCLRYTTLNREGPLSFKTQMSCTSRLRAYLCHMYYYIFFVVVAVALIIYLMSLQSNAVFNHVILRYWCRM